MPNEGSGDRKKTPAERLAELRANAKQITQPAPKKTVQNRTTARTLAPGMALKPPVSSVAGANLDALEAAKSNQREALAQQNQATKKVTQAQANVKQAFAKAAAGTRIQQFNRASGIQKTRTR
jgi:hypothetical protein